MFSAFHMHFFSLLIFCGFFWISSCSCLCLFPFSLARFDIFGLIYAIFCCYFCVNYIAYIFILFAAPAKCLSLRFLLFCLFRWDWERISKLCNSNFIEVSRRKTPWKKVRKESENEWGNWKRKIRSCFIYIIGLFTHDIYRWSYDLYIRSFDFYLSSFNLYVIILPTNMKRN